MASALDIVFLSHHNSVWNFRLDNMRVSFIRLLQGFRVFTFYHFCSQVVPIDRFHSRDQKLGNRRYAAILVDQKCKQTRLHA